MDDQELLAIIDQLRLTDLVKRRITRRLKAATPLEEAPPFEQIPEITSAEEHERYREVFEKLRKNCSSDPTSPQRLLAQALWGRSKRWEQTRRLLHREVKPKQETREEQSEYMSAWSRANEVLTQAINQLFASGMERLQVARMLRAHAKILEAGVTDEPPPKNN